MVALREDARVISTDATRLAVLIDSDNTTAGLATELLEEIAKYGTPTIKRAYGASRSSPDGRSSGCARRPVIGTGCRASWLLSDEDRVVEIHLELDRRTLVQMHVTLAKVARGQPRSSRGNASAKRCGGSPFDGTHR